jgi:hypothetical protein
VTIAESRVTGRVEAGVLSPLLVCDSLNSFMPAAFLLRAFSLALETMPQLSFGLSDWLLCGKVQFE